MPDARETSKEGIQLPEKIARGKLTKVRNAYVLTVGGKKLPLPVGTLADEAVKKLAGKDVSVAYSTTKPGSVVAIGTWPTPEITVPRQKRPCYWWVCYIPAPGLLKPILEESRLRFIDEMVRQRVISGPMGERLKP